ncbi:unnamed protein product [Kuraishia capsulata CBS 1993]|uniref:Uncharacterized protein n=1 Tax=Kuraishia capsulata CBS 1993 TaxID=1382522 RepID=W6MSB1_9ASCO|nr:uncharacterized protein KUCA_T00005577001 [Kuraishia capsulata CBS 1993]CDK29584.1 unnamed protein product [Kuraishia capsulata CBS 1993]
MSIERKATWAALPSTTRAVSVHLSYDLKSDRLAYASGKSVYLRSVANPAETVQFNGHNFNTTVAKFAPSGFYVASGDESGNVKIWDAAGDEQIVKGDYTVINGRINDLAWDADSQRIIAVGDGKERYGHCFTWDSGNTVGEISGHSAVVNAVAIRPVRPYRAATVSDDAGLVFLQGPPFKFSMSVRGNHTNFVRDVAFSKDGNFIVSVGADRAIVLYDGKSGEFLKKIGESSSHEGGIFAVSWVLDSTTEFVTASADASVKLWDAESGELIRTWSLEKSLSNQVLGVVSTKDYIISLTYSGDLYYWTKDSDSPAKIVSGHQKSITSLVEVGDKLYSSSYDGRVVNWDLESGSAEVVAGEGHSNLVVGIAKSETGTLTTAAWDDTVKTIAGGKFTSSSSLDQQPVGIASNGKISVVATEDYLASYEGSTLLKKIKLDFPATTVDISSSVIAVGDASGFNVKLYSTDLTPSSSSLPALRSKPSSLKISPDEKYLAAGDVSGKITLYDLATYTVKTSRWAFHTASINSMSWHKDNDHLVSGSLDTGFIVYSVSKPVKNIKSTNAHKEGTNAVEWLDESTIVTAGSDAALKFWKVTFH